MRISTLLASAAILTVLTPVASAYNRVQGWCEQGNKTITVAGNTSSTNTPVQRSFPRCTVTVYLVGTTTPATIYSTDGGVSLANPFSADANGYWGFFVADGKYDLMFSAGGIPVPFTQGTHGSIDPDFESTITGYVVRTKNAKLADIISVKDFGAVGDGSHDDTTAIANALTYSLIDNTTKTYKCVFFPPGLYTTTAAMSSTHQLCLFGNIARIKYTGSGTITNMFSLIGGSAAPHDTYMEGSIISGLILDGNAKATNGFKFQAVISATMTELRVTNVTGIGFWINWGQQITFNHPQVSLDVEPWITGGQPTTCMTIDGISSANIINALNCDHVSGDGIRLLFAYNSIFQGGTSEGNGGRGIVILGANTSDPDAFRNNINNNMFNLDLEANTGGDVYIGDQSYFNNFFDINSFSIPGITLVGNISDPSSGGCAHYNNFIGGFMGAGSTAQACTNGNRITGVSTIDLTSTPIWVDSGFNYNDDIYNQGNNLVVPQTNQNHTNSYLQNGPFPSIALERIWNYTPTPGLHVGTVWGNPSANWIGFDCQNGFTSCWFQYPITGGMQFIGESSVGVGAVNDGAIKNHKWCIGTFCQTPKTGLSVDIFDGSRTTVGIRSAGVGQGGANLLEFYTGMTSDTLSSWVDNLGKWTGPLTAATTIDSGATGKALCQRSDNTIGHCTSAVNGSGGCTCP